MKAWAIAMNTFREAVRNKILYALLFFALGMIVVGMFMGRLSLDQNARIIQDIGLYCIALFGVVIAIFMGVNLLHEEIQRRTIFVLLSKPIHRGTFVVGKYLGMLLTLAVHVLVMGAAVAFLLWQEGSEVHIAFYQALGLAFVEILVVAAVAVVFSSFSTPYLSGLFTFGVFVLGRLQGDLVTHIPKLEPAAIRGLVSAVAAILPGLHRFDLTIQVIHNQAVAWSTVFWSVAYGVSYAAVVLTLAVLLFGRRDFV